MVPPEVVATVVGLALVAALVAPDVALVAVGVVVGVVGEAVVDGMGEVLGLAVVVGSKNKFFKDNKSSSKHPKMA